jgi:hypothetical protein
MLLGTPLLRMHFALGAQHFIGDLLSRHACTFVAEWAPAFAGATLAR